MVLNMANQALRACLSLEDKKTQLGLHENLENRLMNER